jgi:hypothetical protein
VRDDVVVQCLRVRHLDAEPHAFDRCGWCSFASNTSIIPSAARKIVLPPSGSSHDSAIGKPSVLP